MTKIRKYNGVYKLPIKKHTKVRRPRSHWNVYTTYYIPSGKPYTPVYENGSNFPTEPLVQDISKGLENPLWCEHIFPKDWVMRYNEDRTTYYAPPPKPSIWQRFKRKGRR